MWSRTSSKSWFRCSRGAQQIVDQSHGGVVPEAIISPTTSRRYEDASVFVKPLTVLNCIHTTKEKVTESHNEVHESVTEEKVAKRCTNSKLTMLSVKILNLGRLDADGLDPKVGKLAGLIRVEHR